jgi:PAS domain S-box-containing protein
MSVLQRLRRAAAILAVCAFALSASGGQGGVPPQRTLRIGIGRNNPPFSFVAGGEVRGYWADLARETAMVLGYVPEIRAGAWEDIKADLAAGRLDVAAAMAALPERRAFYDFSLPVSTMTYALWVRKDSSVHSLAGLAGASVVLQQGSAAADSGVLAGSSATLAFVPDDADALTLLDSGLYDAAVLPLAQGLYFAREHRLSRVRALPDTILSVEQCLAVRKGDESLARELDAGLNILKQNGTFEDIYGRWLGVLERPDPYGIPGWLLLGLGIAGSLLAVALAFVLALRRMVRLRTAQLAANERRYRALAESLPQMIFVKDRNLAYVSCNRLFAEAVGIDPLAVAGRTDYDLYPREQADKYRGDDLAAMETAGPISVVEKLSGAGLETWVQTVRAPMRGEDGTVSGVVGIFWDVSERLRLEEEMKRSLKEKEILLQEINHRVKNNLQLINAILRLELDESPRPSLERFVMDATSRISAISTVHEMLYDSEDLADIPVGDYLRRVARGLSGSYSRPGLEVGFSVEAGDIRLDLNSMVSLGLMANEMITNSFKYAFEGRSSGLVRISLSPCADGGGYVFKYADDGIGLPGDFETRERRSLGMVFIESLARQLDGRLEMRRGRGLEYEMSFGAVGARGGGDG